MLGKEEKRKFRLTFDGFNLYPTFLKIRENGELKKFIDLYGDAIYQYYRSIDRNGSSLESKPFIVYGNPTELEKFLAYFLLKNDNLQGKKFTVADLMFIKGKNEEDEEKHNTFAYYPEMAVAYIHRHDIDYGNMQEWRNSNVMQAITTRQRNRLPVILLSEKVVPSELKDTKSFTYIDLFNYAEINKDEEAIISQELPSGKNYNYFN